MVELGTGEVLGCEALLRWNHEQFGPISPVEFIPVAENAGLIDPLTWWVLDRALTQLSVEGAHTRAQRSGQPFRPSLTSPGAREGRAVAAASRHEAGALTLELTESSRWADLVASQRTMRSLKELGVSLSIDDYGTGFSSLTRLKDLPFKELKIDRSFVNGMIHDKGDEAIVRSTIELARSLGRTVTAEGVEDKATLGRLASSVATRLRAITWPGRFRRQSAKRGSRRSTGGPARSWLWANGGATGWQLMKSPPVTSYLRRPKPDAGHRPVTFSL